MVVAARAGVVVLDAVVADRVMDVAAVGLASERNEAASTLQA